jgi:predicted RNase H-like HicB family nuclease
MTFEGNIKPSKKNERYWSVEIPDLGIFTQGKNINDSYSMAADALETIIDKKGFKIKITPCKRNKFLVSANDITPLISLWLQKLRIANNLTVRELSKRLGSNSPRAWAQYESGEICPSIEKLEKLLYAVDPNHHYIIKKAS